MLALPYNGVWPRIAPTAFVAPTAVIVGDVEIGDEASIWFGVVIRGDTAPVRIGARSNVQDNTVIHTDEGMPTLIGADCSVGHAAIVHGATIGDGSLIGMGATLLNRASVGAGCIVAADALLPEGKVVPDGQLAMGAPAKPMRAVNDAERERMRDGIAHYLTYAREYRANIAAAARREPGHTGTRTL
ncbi:MAG TPA: gamma carbonic anhydrase family protein [Ktedonobacterales bacterium]|jgi:carbonic anhydrase/acetyltransferase-like protein (isoleucine patch superfamily)|nr:gamma carbonic anhydrase family protein [Ktedonobacterales bacterium]